MLGEHKRECINYAIEVGELSPSQKQGIVKLIEKKGKDCRFRHTHRTKIVTNNDNVSTQKTTAKENTSLSPTYASTLKKNLPPTEPTGDEDPFLLWEKRMRVMFQELAASLIPPQPQTPNYRCSPSTKNCCALQH